MRLDILTRQLEKNNVRALKYLKSGIDENSIVKALEDYDFVLCPELIELYGWRNGTIWERVPLVELWIAPGYMFFPFEKALETYKNRNGKDEYWRKYMFPAFGSGGGDFHLIDLDKNSKTYGQLFFYSSSSFEFDGIISCFDSLESFIQTMIEWYDKKVFQFSYGEIPSFEADVKLERAIAKKLNPNSDYWKLFD